MSGKRIYLQFDESSYVTDAYVNGMHVGSHAGGYARFRFDITSVATPGADNVIAVKVDNTAAVDPTQNYEYVGGTLGNVAPLSGDFTFFGGLQRDVRILATDNLAITPLDFGGPSVYLKALNGTSYPLHGVAMHQDHRDKGGTFSFKDAQYRGYITSDFDFIRELGATFLRCAHYEHSDFTYSMADQRGVVTWAEDGFVNQIPATCPGQCQPFIDQTQLQLTELIRQNYNHPAIFFWSIGNEVLLRPGPDPTPVIQNLATVAKMEDPTRTVVYAANAGGDSNPPAPIPTRTACPSWRPDRIARRSRRPRSTRRFPRAVLADDRRAPVPRDGGHLEHLRLRERLPQRGVGAGAQHEGHHHERPFDS
jgi:beta-galactosidase